MAPNEAPESAPPPGTQTEADKYLYNEIQTARSALSKIAHDVGAIRGQLCGLQDFRNRIEG